MRRRPAQGLALLAGLALAFTSCGGGGGDERAGAPSSVSSRPATTSTTVARDDTLRLDQIQVIGTHNSFHVAADPKEQALLAALDPAEAATRRYSHPPLGEQLGEQQVRQLELDVFADPRGGLYAHPSLRRQAGLGPLVAPDLQRPGTKVLHEQDVDYHTVCVTLTSCLTDVERWSTANPGHVPVAIGIQLKDGPLIFNVPDQAHPAPWVAAQMDALDTEIRSVFDADQLITPDDVRGSHDTLDAAVRSTGWPTLGESRGKVMFFLVNGDPYRARYLAGHPALQGRVLFTGGGPGQPDGGFVAVDDPVGGAARIKDLVAKGYLVRTRADEPGKEAVADDTSTRDAALASGAQFVSTDYPGPDGAREELGTPYVVALPGGLAARCNPVSAPASCRDAAIGG